MRVWIVLLTFLSSAAWLACSGPGFVDMPDSGVEDPDTGVITIDMEGGTNSQPLVVTPASIQLDVTTGQPIPTQAFTATADGLDVTSKVVWTFGQPEIGDVQSGATFTPTGVVGGKGTLTATWNNRTGSAAITVTIKNVIGGNLTQQQRMALDNPSNTPDPANLVYPADETHFPRGVLGPEMQWNGAQNGDVYRLEIKEALYDYIEYFGNAAGSHLVADKDWDALTQSGTSAKNDPVHVTLTRMSNGTVYAPIKRTWRFAPGSLKGVVYYWQLDGSWGVETPGKIMRLNPGQGTPQAFFTPPQSWNLDSQCWGCHSISRDGRTMVANFYANNAVVVATIDLTKGTAGLVTPTTDVRGVFGGFNDKSDKLLVSNENKLGYANANTSSVDITDKSGKLLAGNVLPAGCGEQSMSPDGKHITAVCKLSCNTWSWDCNQAELWIADIANNTVTNPRVVMQSGSTGRPYFPHFSPDSQWIVFAEQPSGVQWGTTSLSDLWIASLDGKQVKRLTTAMGGSSATNLQNITGNPRFAPLRAGGYNWVVFMSKRDYGNKIVGARRPQIWVTAVDDPPAAPDPSHPPFLLRGQDLAKYNMRAEIALPPCKATTESCTSGSDCCDGQCNKDQNGVYTCSMPKGCSTNGNSCTAKGDCCDPYANCIDGFCQYIPQ